MLCVCEHLVSSSTPMFKISNLIKMRLVSPKNYIRPSGDTRRSTGQASSSQTTPYKVDDSFAPIFVEDNKEVVLEYMRMCQCSQVIAPNCSSTSSCTSVWEDKVKSCPHSKDWRGWGRSNTNEDTTTPLQRKKRKVQPNYEQTIHILHPTPAPSIPSPKHTNIVSPFSNIALVTPHTSNPNTLDKMFEATLAQHFASLIYKIHPLFLHHLPFPPQYMIPQHQALYIPLPKNLRKALQFLLI